jgi:hypothetical protein
MNLFGDLKSPALMYLKAFLFLVAGSAASGALLFENPGLRNTFLLAVAVCSFCRLYYFCFYVIEKYIDPEYRFAGLGSVVTYLLRHRAADKSREAKGASGGKV